MTYNHETVAVRASNVPFAEAAADLGVSGGLLLMPKLLDQVRNLMRVRHYSLRTEEVYTYWIREYIIFHGKRHPGETGEQEITAFLTDLAVKRNALLLLRLKP